MALSDLFRAVAALFARAPAPSPSAGGAPAASMPAACPSAVVLPAAPMQASQPDLRKSDDSSTQNFRKLPESSTCAISQSGGLDWLALCRPLSQHFESCYLTAYPDPASPLGAALQARGIWYRVLAGAPIPADPALRALSGAPWTCGWGSTGPDVREGTTWTQATADARHDANLAAAAALVDSAVTVVLAAHEKAALTSLMNNVGPGRARREADPGRDGIVVLASGAPSTLLRMLNAGDRAGAADQILVWNRAGGVVSAGLVRRRAAERDLFLTGKWSDS